MKIKCEEKNEYVVICLSGKIRGGPDATVFHGHIHEFINANKKNIIVDLAKVEWITSVGLGMLTATLTTTKREGGQFKISEIPEKVLSIITIAGLVKAFDIYDTLEEAIQSL